MYKAIVLSVGVVNIISGNTQYDWSIYDNTGLYAFLTNRGFLLFGRENSLKIGDSVKLFGNDSNRSLGKEGNIIDSSKCDAKELLQMLKKNGYDYTPLKAFAKRTTGARRLTTSYSIKGITNL